MPASSMTGAITLPALEQVEPIIPTICSLTISFWAAACPPSGEQPVSSPTSSIGCPSNSPPTSSMAISTPRIESIPRFELGPEVSNPYPIRIGSPGFTTTTSDVVSACSGVAGADGAGPVVVGADVSGPVVVEVVSSVSPAPQADIATAIIAMTSTSDNSLLISFHSFLSS